MGTNVEYFCDLCEAIVSKPSLYVFIRFEGRINVMPFEDLKDGDEVHVCIACAYTISQTRERHVASTRKSSV